MLKQKIIAIALPADLAYSALIRQFSEEVFARHQFNSIWCHRLKLVVDELFMNAVKYGSPGSGGIIHIKFIDEGEQMTFMIEDEGSGESPVSAAELKKRMDKNRMESKVTRTSGRGLSIITRLWTDAMEIKKSEYGGIQISIRKKKTDPINVPPPHIRISAVPLETIKAETKEKNSQNYPTYTLKLGNETDEYSLNQKSRYLQEAIQKIPPHSVLVLDFHEVHYINSIFIGHLAGWFNHLKERDIRLKIVRMNREIREVLDLVGLSKVVDINELTS